MTRFTLTVDLDAISGDVQQELARILRYWAGNVRHYPRSDGTGEVIYDATYTPVGQWVFSDDATPADVAEDVGPEASGQWLPT